MLRLRWRLRRELRGKFPPGALYLSGEKRPKSGCFSAWVIVVLVLAAGARSDASAPRTEPPQLVRVAAISLVPIKLDLTGNAGRLEAAFRAAARGGARLAVAPEGALDGYVINEVLAGQVPLAGLNEVAIPIDHPVIHRFQSLAKELDICLVFGFAERIGRDIFNTAVFLDQQGAIRGKYHKMQFAEGYHPGWWFNRLGSQSRAFDTPFGRCGILICNDRWNPALAKIPALDGAQLLIIPAYGSTSRSQDEAVLDRARETGLPIVEANVGVGLVVSEGRIAAVERQKEGMVFADVVIPGPRPENPVERDRVEKEFLAWRAGEMTRRFDAKKHALAAER